MKRDRLSMLALSKAVQVPYITLQRLLAGQNEPRYSTLAPLAAYFDCTVEDLLNSDMSAMLALKGAESLRVCLDRLQRTLEFSDKAIRESGLKLTSSRDARLKALAYEYADLDDDQFESAISRLLLLCE